LRHTLPAVVLAWFQTDAVYYFGSAAISRRPISPLSNGMNTRTDIHPGWMGGGARPARQYSRVLVLVRAGLLCSLSVSTGRRQVLPRPGLVLGLQGLGRVDGRLWLLNYSPSISRSKVWRVLLHLGSPSTPFFCDSEFAEGSGGAGGPNALDLATFGSRLSLCLWGRTEAVVLAAAGRHRLGVQPGRYRRARASPGGREVRSRSGSAMVRGILIANGSSSSHSGADEGALGGRGPYSLIVRAWLAVIILGRLVHSPIHRWSCRQCTRLPGQSELRDTGFYLSYCTPVRRVPDRSD